MPAQNDHLARQARFLEWQRKRFTNIQESLNRPLLRDSRPSAAMALDFEKTLAAEDVSLERLARTDSSVPTLPPAQPIGGGVLDPPHLSHIQTFGPPFPISDLMRVAATRGSDFQSRRTGFYFETLSERFCTVTISGRYFGGWTNFNELSEWRLTGGLAMTVAESGSAMPLLARQVNLMNIHGAGQGDRGQVSGEINNATQVDWDGSTFGPVSLFPIHFYAVPGKVYVVVLTLYITAAEGADEYCMATLGTDIGSFTVTLSRHPPGPN